jgi:hypothetical protein
MLSYSVSGGCLLCQWLFYEQKLECIYSTRIRHSPFLDKSALQITSIHLST